MPAKKFQTIWDRVQQKTAWKVVNAPKTPVWNIPQVHWFTSNDEARFK